MKNLVFALLVLSLATACSAEDADPVGAAANEAGDEVSLTPKAVVEKHMQAFEGNDMDEIVGDYADDVVFILPNDVLQGREAVYGFFAPQRSVETPPALTYEIHSAEGSVVVAPWTLGAGTPAAMSGRDVFVVEDGKILVQTVFIESAPQ